MSEAQSVPIVTYFSDRLSQVRLGKIMLGQFQDKLGLVWIGCVVLVQVELGWVGLVWAVLVWAGLGLVKLGWGRIRSVRRG